MIVIIMLCMIIPGIQMPGNIGGAPTRSNTPPNAVVTSPQNGGSYPDSRGILFDASQSTDPDGDPLSYTWTIMMFPPQPGPNMFPIIRYSATFTESLDVGSWMVTVDVNDSIDSASQLIQISVIHNNPPTAVIANPTAGDIFTSIEEISFSAAGSADPDGDGLAYHWESSLGGNLSESESFSTLLEVGTHTIKLYVQDIYETKSDIQEIEITVRIPNYQPTIFITAPDSSNPRTGEDFLIEWTATDANINDMLTIDIYYNTVKGNADNHLIATGLPDIESYLWDCSDLENGKYYVYGVATDGEQAEGTSWSAGFVHVHKNYSPTPVTEVNIEDDHDLSPTLIWEESTDPNEDSISYIINIGTTQRGKEIVNGEMTSKNRYRVSSQLEYNRTYYLEITTRDNWNMNSTIFETTFILVNKAPLLPEIIINPQSPTSTTTLHCIITKEAVDPDGDELDYTYRWHRMTPGGFFEEETDIFDEIVPTSRLRAGDMWKCTVDVSDGHTMSVISSPVVTVENIRPVAVIASPKTIEEIYSTVSGSVEFSAKGSFDDDGDEIDFLWESNLDGTLGNEETISFRLRSGVHQITLSVSDGEDLDTARITVIVEPQTIVIKDLFVSPASARSGEKIIVYASIRNTGGDAGKLLVEFLVNNNPVSTDTIDAIPHDSTRESKRFEWASSTPGVFKMTIRVGEAFTETTVRVTGSQTDGGVSSLPSSGETGDSGKGLWDQISGRPWLILVIIGLLGVIVIFGLLAYKENKLKKKRITRDKKNLRSGRAEYSPIQGLYDPVQNYMPGMQTYLPPTPFFDERIFESARLLPVPTNIPPEKVIDISGSPNNVANQPASPSLDDYGKRIDVDMEGLKSELNAIPIPAGKQAPLETLIPVTDETLMVECYKCGGDIPVTSDDRPLIVVCPGCGTEGELN